MSGRAGVESEAVRGGDKEALRARALISSIKSASSPDEIAALIALCRGVIAGLPTQFQGKLNEQLTTIANRAEDKIHTVIIRVDDPVHTQVPEAVAAAPPADTTAPVEPVPEHSRRHLTDLSEADLQQAIDRFGTGTLNYESQRALDRKESIMPDSITDTTRPATADMLKEFKQIPPPRVATSDGKASSKIFQDNDTHIIIKKTKDGKFRQLDIDVRKGPALVALAMSDEHGNKDKASKFVIEYDKVGNPISTIPDLSLAQTEPAHDGKPPISFIEIDGKKMVIPMHPDRVATLQKQMKIEPLQAPVIEVAVDASVGPAVSVVASPPHDTGLSSAQEYTSYVNILEAEHASGAFRTTNLERPEARSGGSVDIELGSGAGAGSGVGVGTGVTTNVGESAAEATNQNSATRAREISVVETKANKIKELADAVKNEVSAVARGDRISMESAQAKQVAAKAGLRGAGLADSSIKIAEKAALTATLSKSIESGMDKEISGGDPIIEAREKVLLKQKMNSSGMTRDEIKEAELDATLKAGARIAAKLQAEKAAVPSDQGKQAEIEGQIAKLGAIQTQKTESLTTASTSTIKAVVEGAQRTSIAFSGTPHVGEHKQESGHGQGQTTGPSQYR